MRKVLNNGGSMLPDHLMEVQGKLPGEDDGG